MVCYGLGFVIPLTTPVISSMWKKMQEALFFGAGAGKNTVAFGLLRQNLVKYELRNSCSNWLGGIRFDGFLF